MEISFQKQYALWAAAADDDDPRVVLQHVCIEPSGVMVAANGFCCAVVPCEIMLEDGEKPRRVLVSAKAVKLAVQNAPKKGLHASITVDQDEATVNCKGYRALTTLWTDSEFPDWKGLFPEASQISLDHQTLSVDLMSRLAKALGTEALDYVFTGAEGPVLVLPLASEGIGTIMPMRHVGDTTPQETANKRLERFAR